MISCKNCGANAKYDIESGKMLCKYCGSYFDPYEFEYEAADAEEHESDIIIDDVGSGNGTYETTVFTCPECAGEIISEENEAATFCSFCGASTVLASRLAKKKRPSSIIPFKITKEQCKDIYKKRMGKAWFAPSYYKDEKNIDSFRGIYMPYWVFNIKQQGSVAIKGEKHYRKGNYRIEEEYDVDFDLKAEYDGISHDASSSFADNISGAIAPYNHSDAVKFTPAFISGFYADTTDVDEDLYEEDAKELANQAAMKTVASHHDVSGITLKYPSGSKSDTLHTAVSRAEEAMYPVWFMSHRSGNRVTYATVNGVTGKIAADIPIDIKRYFLGSMLAAIPFFALFMLLPTFVPRFTLYIASILLIIGFIAVIVESKSVSKREKNVGDKAMQKRMLNNEDEIPKTNNFVSMGLSALAFIVAVIVLVSKPIFDAYYYGAASFELIASIVSYIVVIQDYNLLSTRKLPQFNRKGGDDRA